MDVLYMIIPAYNEEENLRETIAEWYPIVEKHSGRGLSRLVVVDDGSRDSTPEILAEEAAKRPLLVNLRKENGGHGAAVLYGYRYALENGADYVFQTDSDGQTLPSEFEPFWRQKERFDMVIGQRVQRQDGLSRIFVTKVLKLVLFCVFHVWIKDANTPYRLMEAKTLRRAMKYVDENEPLSNVMLSVVYAKKKKRVLFRPITFRPRQGGVNSINIPRIFRIGRDALKRFSELKARLKKDL